MPVKFDRLVLKDSLRLDGRRVAAPFTVGTVPFTWGEGDAICTVAAPRTTDGTERTAILKGNRLVDADRGAHLRVVGTLRAIRHRAAVMPGGAQFAGWTEIRVEEE